MLRPSLWRRRIAVSALAAVTLIAASTAVVRSQHPASQDVKRSEGNFLRAYQRYYLRPRAFPHESPAPNARLRAYARLERMRVELKRPHIDSFGPNKPPGSTTPPGPGPGPIPPGTIGWRSVGPTNINGRVTDLAIDPTNASHVFLATVGGIWRSTDSARNWQFVTDAVVSEVFGAVAVRPDGGEIVAGTGDPNYSGEGGNPNGIWASPSGDPGTWAKTSPAALDGYVVKRLIYDATAPYDVYAATDHGVWKGVHGGGTITWTMLGGFDAATSGLALDTSVTPRLVYAGVQVASATYAQGIWKYDGTAWARKDGGIPWGDTSVVTLALAPSAPSTLYAKIAKSSNGDLLGIFKTTTGGEPPGGNAWQLTPGGASVTSNAGSFFYSWYNAAIAVDPGDPNTVYAGGVDIYRSTNGGMTFDDIAGGNDATFPLGTHSDHHAVAFDPTNPKIAYVGDDGGVFRTTDTSLSAWRWNDVSHGLIVTQFYKLATTSAFGTLVLGASQDNGFEATFGNRTWYSPYGCDGYAIAVDSSNPDTFYALSNCSNNQTFALTNPVPGTVGGGTTFNLTLPAGSSNPGSPFATDPSVAQTLLTTATGASGPEILRSVDGTTTTVVPGITLPAATTITAVASAATNAFKTYYVGLVANGTPTIYATTNGGTNWATTPSGLPGSLQPNAIAVSASDDHRAFAGYGGFSGGAVYMTTDAGSSWSDISGSGTTGIPAAVTAIAADPSDPNTVYAGTSIGVFKGAITTAPSLSGSWIPFDEGLPDGADITDLWANPATKMLTVAAFGHGAYQRDIRLGATAPAGMLVVRDNVYDTGVTPSPYGVADPEHPVPGAPPFYKPDATPEGQLYWWTSPDIRIDVPSADSPANQLAGADTVEFETCPTAISNCPPGTLVDRSPQRGKAANVYVQVNDNGLTSVGNVRVIALYADATAAVPDLPATFWTTTFPAGTTSCGALDTSTGWHLPDPANPCVVIPNIDPQYPQVAKFAWNVPLTQAQHSCMLVIVESADDPIPAATRASNELRAFVLVPNDRHIAQRNLHIIDAPGGGAPKGGTELVHLNFGNRDARFGLSVSTLGLGPEARMSVFLPTALSKPETAGTQLVQHAAPIAPKKGLSAFQRYQVDPTREYVLTGTRAVFSSPPFAKDAYVFVRYRTGKLVPGTSVRFTIRQTENKRVVGGGTYLIRSGGGRGLLQPRD